MEKENKIEQYELKIAALKSEINMLKLQLTNAEKRVLNEQMLRELDRLMAK